MTVTIFANGYDPLLREGEADEAIPVCDLNFWMASLRAE
jgi:hypothetical protein